MHVLKTFRKQASIRRNALIIRCFFTGQCCLVVMNQHCDDALKRKWRTLGNKTTSSCFTYYLCCQTGTQRIQTADKHKVNLTNTCIWCVYNFTLLMQLWLEMLSIWYLQFFAAWFRVMKLNPIVSNVTHNFVWMSIDKILKQCDTCK